MHASVANERYLRNTVLTASPTQLRLMLLDRAVAVTQEIIKQRIRQPQCLVDQWTLRLRDLLGELLGGVTRQGGELAHRVADLYVFLIQELTRAEQQPGTDRVTSILRVLEIEQETWRKLCQQQSEPPRQASESDAEPRESRPANPAHGPVVAEISSPPASLNLNL